MAALIVPLLAAALSAPVLGQDIASVDVTVVTGPGTGVYEVFIAPDGWVEDCRVLRSDYSPENNSRVCGELLRLEARTPARGPDGKPIHAVAIVSRQRGAGEVPQAADIEVDVAALPGAANGRKRIDLAVLVDERGTIRQCEPRGGTADAYSRVACEQANGLEFAPREDRNGIAVPYLALVAVDFVASRAAS